MQEIQIIYSVVHRNICLCMKKLYKLFLLRFLYRRIYLYRYVCIKSVYLRAVDRLLPNLVFRRNSEKLETFKWRAWFMIFKMTEHTCLQASQSTCILSTWIGWDWSSVKLINTDFILKGLSSTFRHLWPKSKKKNDKVIWYWVSTRPGHSCDL